MINYNLPLVKDGACYAIVLPRSDNQEIADYERKWKGIVNVKISKPISQGTYEQNAAMHALLQAYYATGMHSAPEPFNKNIGLFKLWIKMSHGPCYTMDMDGKQVSIPKSWSNYTKIERVQLIEGLLIEIYSSGAYSESEKLRKIIKGMELRSNSEKLHAAVKKTATESIPPG